MGPSCLPGEGSAYNGLFRFAHKMFENGHIKAFTYVKKIYIETLHKIASDNTSPIR